jgi:hypothetical protein
MVEGVGHRKLIAFIRVGHVKICRNVFKGMCMKIHIIELYCENSCCTIIFECVLNYYAQKQWIIQLTSSLSEYIFTLSLPAC